MRQQKQGSFSPEVREQTPHHALQWAAITAIAPKMGCTKETLRCWVREAEHGAGGWPGPSRVEEGRLKALERQGRELRLANEILRKASALSAQAELVRPRR